MHDLLALITSAWLMASTSAFIARECSPTWRSRGRGTGRSVGGGARSPFPLEREPVARRIRLALDKSSSQRSSSRAKELAATGLDADKDTQISGGVDSAEFPPTTGLIRVYQSWWWRGYKINFRAEGPEDGPPILLIHGFGASVGHFRRNFPVLVGAGYRVYAVDLLGFGSSDKPKDVTFSLELWKEMLVDFIEAKSRDASEQWVVMGNSIGGLLTLMLTEQLQEGRKVRGSVLFNTAGGLVSFRPSELPVYLVPVMWFFNNVVFGPYWGPRFFANFKTEGNVRSVLKQVYAKDVVDEELVNMMLLPSDDEGACDVFLKIFTGPPGPTPASLLQKIKDTKVLALWGEKDPWTPLNKGLHSGASLGQHLDTFELVTLPETGHCPHDESPEECHEVLLPWLQALP